VPPRADADVTKREIPAHPRVIGENERLPESTCGLSGGTRCTGLVVARGKRETSWDIAGVALCTFATGRNTLASWGGAIRGRRAPTSMRAVPSAAQAPTFDFRVQTSTSNFDLTTAFDNQVRHECGRIPSPATRYNAWPRTVAVNRAEARFAFRHDPHAANEK
jgi:hypothetical protein